MTKLFSVEERTIADIKINNRSRKQIGDLHDLVESIHSSGQLNPILITQENELIAGERRIRALQELGELTVLVRVMPNISMDDRLIIERMENVARKDFEWHEELNLRYELHKLWKEQAEKENKTWGYRETAKELKCSLGGLSSDLALADALATFPELKDQASKSRARDMYKKIGEQAAAIHRMDNLSEEEKERMKNLQTGSLIPKSTNGKDNSIPTATHEDSNPVWEEFNQLLDDDDDDDELMDETNLSDSIKPSVDVVYAVENYKTFLDKIPNNTVGLVELDPPYAIGFNENYGKASKIQSKADDWTVEMLYDFYYKYLPKIYEKMMSSGWVLCWTGKEHAEATNQIAEDIGFTVQPPGIWKKASGSTNQPKTNLTSNYEMYLLFRKGNAQFNTASLAAAVEFPSVPAQQKIHQWEKPLALYDHFLKALGLSSAIFLSLFAGSGNALISAAKNGMLPMGCDSNQKYVAQFYHKLQNYVNIK